MPENLEPIETASIDELRALQLERLQWSISHTFDNFTSLTKEAFPVIRYRTRDERD
jgi:phenylacetate-CoA ligase